MEKDLIKLLLDICNCNDVREVKLTWTLVSERVVPNITVEKFENYNKTR